MWMTIMDYGGDKVLAEGSVIDDIGRGWCCGHSW